MKPPQPPKKLVSAKDVLAGVLNRPGYDPSVFALFDLWDRLLGAEADKAKAVGFRGGRLYVEVDTSVRTHGLVLRKRELIKKINGAFGGSAPLSDIIFRPGPRSFTDGRKPQKS